MQNMLKKQISIIMIDMKMKMKVKIVNDILYHDVMFAHYILEKEE